MKSVELQPLSALVGALGLGALAISMSMAPPAGGPSPLPRAVVVELAPRASSLVTIIEGDSFVVPDGKVLVVKTFGAAQGDFLTTAVLKIDGEPVFSAFGSSVPLELALGVSARAGDVVTVEETFADPFTMVAALGYLAND